MLLALANTPRFLSHRDKLREQNALSEEIVNAITNNQLGNEAIDDADLEDELEAMEQEQLDEKILKTGTGPVSDAIQRLPAAANGERKSGRTFTGDFVIKNSTDKLNISQGKGNRRGRRRRGGRAQEIAGRDGHVTCDINLSGVLVLKASVQQSAEADIPCHFISVSQFFAQSLRLLRFHSPQSHPPIRLASLSDTVHLPIGSFFALFTAEGVLDRRHGVLRLDSNIKGFASRTGDCYAFGGTVQIHSQGRLNKGG